MNIGYDAKRIVRNGTGLGSYGRTLINSLSAVDTKDTFLLYTPDDIRRWVLSKLKDEMPYLYIYTGAGDELEQRIFQSTETTYDILQECYPPELLNEVILFENRHNEKAWAEIFPDFLHTFLFA